MSPAAGETKTEACSRVQGEVLSELGQYKNCLVFMSSATRVAKPHESLANAAKRHGSATLSQVGIGFTERNIFPGHCAMALIDAKGDAPQEQTFSLRPDPNRSPYYKALTAPDPRLPAYLTAAPTLVRPAIHTSLELEIDLWAKDAFYAYYVHHKNEKRNENKEEPETYDLHCFIKQLNHFELERYLHGVKAMKASCKRYSLLDHYQQQKIVRSENCTMVSKLVEWMAPTHSEFKKFLGDNPTPQLVAEVMRRQLLQYKGPEPDKDGLVLESGKDALSQPFWR
jgi:hypothetical protein